MHVNPDETESSPVDEPEAHQPLAGIRVVELGSSVAAPYAAWLLAALGADVLKVERPGSGDDARQWGQLFADGRSSFYEALNRDKRGISVDLKDEAQRLWLRRLCVSEVDVVVQNLRPGSVEEYGLGAAELVRENRRLVYCNLGAFGDRGPLRAQPGYDPLMQACGGIMSVTGEEGRPPVRVGTSIIDMGTGMWCAIGILAALKRREATGRGCVVDASLYETAIAWMATHATVVQAAGRSPGRQGSGVHGLAPYQAYACSDGYLVIAAPNERLFARLAEALGHPEWAADARFDSNQKRYRNLEALNRLLEPEFARHPREYWQETLEAAGVPSAPVRAAAEVLEHEQTRALEMLQSLPGDTLRLVGMPLRFDGRRPPLRRRAPTLGQHDAEVKTPPRCDDENSHPSTPRRPK